MNSAKQHKIILPKLVVVGNNIASNITRYLEEINVSTDDRIALITGPHVYEKISRKIEERLKASGLKVSTWIVESPHISVAEKVAAETGEQGITIYLGIGGGKSIDIAKYSASRNNGLLVSVPTAASHDGITSPFASLKGRDKPTSMPAVTPTLILADISIISRAPRRLNLSGVGDLIGKLTAVKDWQLAHRLKGEYYGEYAAQLALLSAKHVLRYHELIGSGNPDGIRILVEALISSGVAMCIAGSSRPASGSEHLFSHALDILAPGKALHGEQVGVGTIMMLYLYGDKRWKKVRSVMKRIGLPVTARELGIPAEIIVKALTIAHRIRPERYTILGENGLTPEAAWRLAKETGVIE